jgi:hypothetical protein
MAIFSGIKITSEVANQIKKESPALAERYIRKIQNEFYVGKLLPSPLFLPSEIPSLPPSQKNTIQHIQTLYAIPGYIKTWIVY